MMMDDNDDVRADGELRTNKDIGVKSQMEGLNEPTLGTPVYHLW